MYKKKHVGLLLLRNAEKKIGTLFQVTDLGSNTANQGDCSAFLMQGETLNIDIGNRMEEGVIWEKIAYNRKITS